MPVQRRSRVVAGAGVLAAVSAVGVGAAVAPGAASAPIPAAPAPAAQVRAAQVPAAAAEYPHAVRRAAVTGSGPAVLGTSVPTAVRAARVRTRLALAVRPLRGRLQVTGVLT